MFSKEFKIFIYLLSSLIFLLLVVGFRIESVMAAGLNTDYVKVTVEHTPAAPPTAHNVSGWAWSDNIGWISFSCDNPEFPNCTNDFGVDIDEDTGMFSGYAWSDNIGWIDFSPSGSYPDAPDYSACLDFPGAGEPCDGIGDYKVAGWVRTVNTGDGWYGWIKLRDDAVYADGVSLNDSTNEFEGWAWSDDLGWISFNCIEDGTCATSDYKVKYSPSLNQPPTCTSLSAVPTEGETPLDVSFTGEGSDSDGTIVQYEFDFGDGPPLTTPENTADHTYNSAGTYCAKLKVQDDKGSWSPTPGDCPDVCTEEIVVVELNNPPTAGISCDPTGCHNSSNPTYQCLGYTGCTFRLVNESDDPDPGDSINYTEWDIYSWSSDPDLDCSSKCDFTPSGLSADDYTIELYVEDKNGASDTATKDFIIYQEAISDFMCSLSGEDGSWQDCKTISVSEGELVYFRDNLLTSSHYSSPSDGATLITERVWQKQKQGESSWIDFSPPYDSNSSNASTTLEQGSSKIRLRITDNNSVTGPRTVFNDLPVGYKVIGVKVPPPEWKEVSPF